MEQPAGHRGLRVWQEAMDLAQAVYALTREFPRDEVYGLTSQLNRAAVSVRSNLAVGYGRSGRDYERFVGMAYVALLELGTQTELAARVGLIAEPEARTILERTAAVGKMLNALRNGLKRRRIHSAEKNPNPAPRRSRGSRAASAFARA